MAFTLKLSSKWALVSSLLVLGGLAAAGCQQPDLNCTVYHGYYAAKFELESGDPESACGAIPGDVLGLNVYYADKGGRPDLDKGSVSIRPQYVNDLIFHALEQGVADLSMEEGTQSVGDFTTGRPASNEFCEVPTLSDASVSIPEVPEVPDDPETPDDDESYPLQPATTVSYDWSNFKVLVNADAQGTQFSADLRFQQDDCAAEFHVTALYPVVSCETNADCEDDLNGINPDFATECLTELGLCVLSEEPPSYL